MHELSIAMSIVEAAEEEALRCGAARVTAVYLRLGVLSGVAKETLLFSYGVACESTALEGSQLVIEEMPIVAYCPACHALRTIRSPQRLACPECGGSTADIQQGKELEVIALEIEE